VTRLVALAVLGILLLGAGAIALIYLTGEGEAPGPTAEGVAPAPPAPATVPPAVLAAPDPGQPARSAGSGPQPAAGAQVTAPPPAMPADPEERADRLLEMRKERRDDALEQMYAREAERRRRLGLPAAPPPPRR
jgi:hypothetical protein